MMNFFMHKPRHYLVALHQDIFIIVLGLGVMGKDTNTLVNGSMVKGRDKVPLPMQMETNT